MDSKQMDLISGVEETSAGKTGVLRSTTPEDRAGQGVWGSALRSARTNSLARRPEKPPTETSVTEAGAGSPSGFPSVRSDKPRPSSALIADRIRRLAKEIDPILDTVAAMQLSRAAKHAADLLDPPPGSHSLKVIGDPDAWRGVCKCGWLGDVRLKKTWVQRDYRGHLDES